MRTIIILILFPIAAQLFGQFPLENGDRQVDRIDIPFEFINGFIVVDLTFNHIFPMRFILDTGAEHTILTKREYADLMNIPFEREFRIIGSDMRADLKAYLIRHVHLRVGSMALSNQSLVVMDDDYFRFEEFTGVPIQGIIGANIFRHFVMKINYQREVISLYRPSSFEPPEDYEEIPIEVFKNKPYLTALLDQGNQITIPVKLLLDTGASLTLLLHNGSHPAIRPSENTVPGNIGKGLGGYLEGFVGRSQSLELGTLAVSEVITNYQDLLPGMDTSFMNQRNGILGNMVLGRFHVIIDYYREKVYLKPNRYFDEAFVYDRSGLVVIASGKSLNTFSIYSIVNDSPAGRAGLLPGDEIVRINWMSTGFIGLEGINRKLRKKPGKKINMVIRRNGEKMRIIFYLEELI